MQKVWISLAFLTAALSLRAVNLSTYQYTGKPFTLFSCGPSGTVGTLDCPWGDSRIVSSYSPSDFVLATLKLSSPLAPNLNLQDVTGLPGFQLTISDGVQTFSTATSPPGVVAQ